MPKLVLGSYKCKRARRQCSMLEHPTIPGLRRPFTGDQSESIWEALLSLPQLDENSREELQGGVESKEKIKNIGRFQAYLLTATDGVGALLFIGHDAKMALMEKLDSLFPNNVVIKKLCAYVKAVTCGSKTGPLFFRCNGTQGDAGAFPKDCIHIGFCPLTKNRYGQIDVSSYVGWDEVGNPARHPTIMACCNPKKRQKLSREDQMKEKERKLAAAAAKALASEDNSDIPAAKVHMREQVARANEMAGLQKAQIALLQEEVRNAKAQTAIAEALKATAEAQTVIALAQTATAEAQTATAEAQTEQLQRKLTELRKLLP